MRQKRIFMILAIIVATLVLSIAYAAITSQTLKITGEATATTSDTNFDVKFESYTISGDGTTTATIDATNNKNATIDVSGLTTEGQQAIVDFVVFNDSIADITANLGFYHTNSNTTWYDVDIGFPNVDYYGGSMYLLEQGETTSVRVIITLKQTPVTDSDVSAAKTTIDINISASPFAQ